MNVQSRATTLGVTVRWIFLALLIFLVAAATGSEQYRSQSQISKDGTTVLLEDYANPPLSSPTHGGVTHETINYQGQLGRVTSLRSEPANAPLAASRFFVDDQSRALYILNKATKEFTPYINFVRAFPKFVSDVANDTPGIVSFAFDPDYAKNGKFYTVHVEKPEMEGSASPTNSRMPSLNLSGYTVTPAMNPQSGSGHLESVLIEWTDTNIRNSTFEGTARELLRVGYFRGHPMADLVFNPLARPGSQDYGNLYISFGDSVQGETPEPGHTLPQQLNTLVGKILRITPDVHLHPKDQLSSNSRYRIPSTGQDPNPFVSVTGACGEIYAYGFRNPHRMTWDPPSNTLLVNDFGLHSWEEINIVIKGENYGYAQREGNEQLFVDGAGKTGSQVNPPVPFPEKDRLAVEGIAEPVTPRYPAAVYSHQEGDSIGSGFVYRGTLMPQLRGKYVFNDTTTGRIFYVDLDEMIATHGKRNRQAQIHELQIMYKGRNDQSAVKHRMFDIVADNYLRKGGTPAPDHVLPSTANATTGWNDAEHHQPKTDPEGVAYGGGRAEVRMAIGGDAELYVLSKSDGAIRKMTAARSDGLSASGLSSPYRLVDNWAKLPEGRTWGDVGAVAVDTKGNVWAIERCGANTCAGSKVDPILEFDPSGKLLKSFGAGMLVFPHSIYVDKTDNVWVADERGANEKELAASPDAKGKGLVVIKFTPNGKVLMTLGSPGIAGNLPNAFIMPSCVLVGSKGDIFVAEGDPEDSGTNARIVKFSKEGKFIKTWGKKGSSPGEFDTPHALAMDSKGRLFVADRENNRIQVFDQDGKFLKEWKQFGDPTGMFIDANDILYVSDTQSDQKSNPGFTRGIRIGSAKDGVVKAFIPALGPEEKTHRGRSFAGSEAVAVDAMGNIYAAESRARHLRKYAKVQ